MAHFHVERRKKEWKKYQQVLKLKAKYDSILVEVKAVRVRALNKAPEQWSVGQLRSMVKWHKRDELDKAMPGKKTDLLTRYHETYNRGERTAPALPEAPPLPPSPTRDVLHLLPPMEDEELNDKLVNAIDFIPLSAV